MILADTSVWVNHLRHGEPNLQRALLQGKVLTHPFVIGEIACGNLRSRSETFKYLRRLPSALPATHDEVFYLLEEQRLFGKGLGWVDAHLLASARLTGCRLWTLDVPLRAAAAALRVGYSGLM